MWYGDGQMFQALEVKRVVPSEPERVVNAEPHLA